MNSDEKILKALEDLQAGQKELQSDVASIKDVQQKQGEHLESLEAGQKNLEAGQKTLQANVKDLHGKVDTVELKVEAIQEYQKQAHDEIMEKVFESNEINGKEQKALEKRIEVIEESVGIPHPEKN